MFKLKIAKCFKVIQVAMFTWNNATLYNFETFGNVSEINNDHVLKNATVENCTAVSSCMYLLTEISMNFIFIVYLCFHVRFFDLKKV